MHTRCRCCLIVPRKENLVLETPGQIPCRRHEQECSLGVQNNTQTVHTRDKRVSSVRRTQELFFRSSACATLRNVQKRTDDKRPLRHVHPVRGTRSPSRKLGAHLVDGVQECIIVEMRIKRGRLITETDFTFGSHVFARLKLPKNTSALGSKRGHPKALPLTGVDHPGALGHLGEYSPFSKPT